MFIALIGVYFCLTSEDGIFCNITFCYMKVLPKYLEVFDFFSVFINSMVIQSNSLDIFILLWNVQFLILTILLFKFMKLILLKAKHITICRYFSCSYSEIQTPTSKRHPHEYLAIFVFTLACSTERVMYRHHPYVCVCWYIVWLSYVCNVTTLFMPTLNMHAYSAT